MVNIPFHNSNSDGISITYEWDIDGRVPPLEYCTPPKWSKICVNPVPWFLGCVKYEGEGTDLLTNGFIK